MANSKGNFPTFNFTLVPKKLRLEVVINESPTYLTLNSYLYLLILAVQAVTTPDGWIHKSAFDDTFNSSRNINKLARELGEQGTALKALIENDQHGNYRLNIPPEKLKFDIKAIGACPDHRISKFAEQLDKLVPVQA